MTFIIFLTRFLNGNFIGVELSQRSYNAPNCRIKGCIMTNNECLLAIPTYFFNFSTLIPEIMKIRIMTKLSLNNYWTQLNNFFNIKHREFHFNNYEYSQFWILHQRHLTGRKTVIYFIHYFIQFTLFRTVKL